MPLSYCGEGSDTGSPVNQYIIQPIMTNKDKMILYLERLLSPTELTELLELMKEEKVYAAAMLIVHKCGIPPEKAKDIVYQLI